MTSTIKDNTVLHRYELEIDGHIAFADYRKTGSTLTLPYVEAPEALRGTGAAGELMEAVMQRAPRGRT